MKWVLRGFLALVALLVIAFLIFRTPDTDAAAMRAKYGGPPSQFVEIGDGVTVHLRDEGPRDALPVVLLHGIWNNRPVLWPLAARLRAAGFETETFGYPSVFGGAEAAVMISPRPVQRAAPA